VFPEAGGFMKSDKIILHLQHTASQPSPRVKLSAKTSIQGTPPYFFVVYFKFEAECRKYGHFFSQVLRIRDILVCMDRIRLFSASTYKTPIKTIIFLSFLFITF
jgi:hypothetical protein